MAFLGLGFLILHFSATFLFTSPLKNHENENIHYVVNGYMHPLFWQNWSLFVPAPKDNKKIEIAFKEEKGYTEFKDPLENAYRVFKWLRYGPEGKIILGFDNTLWWVYDDLRKLNIPWNRELEGTEAIRFQKMNGYFLLRNLVLGAHKKLSEGEFPGAKVKFIVVDVELRQEYFLIVNIEE
ncbi:MAG: DUF5819 family protein [Crocinitomicaceae bacterium]